MSKTMQQAIEYVASQIDLNELSHAVEKSYTLRQPLQLTNSVITDSIYELLEEYGADNDLPENYWLDYTDSFDTLADWILNNTNNTNN